MGPRPGPGITCIVPLLFLCLAARPQGTANALLEEAEALRLRGDAASLHDAAGKYTDAARQFAVEGAAIGQAKALFGLGETHDALSEKRRAIEAYTRALALFREQADRGGAAEALIQIGLDYDYLGERKRAADFASQALVAAPAGNSDGVKATVLTHAGQIYQRAGQTERSLELFGQALPLQRALHNPRGEATVLSGMGVAYYSTGHTRDALDHLLPALELYRSVQDLRDEAFTLTSIGAVYYSTDDYPQALRYFAEADPKWEQCGDRSGQSANLHNLASAYERTGELEKAIAAFTKALPLHRQANYRIGEANTLTSLGTLHAGLGDYTSALEFYREALPLHQGTTNKQGEAATLQNIGDIYGAQGDYQRALEYFARALPLRRAIADRPGEASALNRIGFAQAHLGDHARARDSARQSLDLYREIGSPRGQALSLHTLAVSSSLSGDSSAAIESFRESARLSETAGDLRGQASAHFGIAREQNRSGKLAESRREIESAIALAESVRGRVPSPELRSFYFASIRDYFDLQIDTLMRMGQPVEALDASERSRARSLIDMLYESLAGIRQGVDPALLDRERSLGRLLDATAGRYLALSLTKPSEAEKLSANLTRLTADFREAQADIRAHSPRYAALVSPPPIDAAQLRAMLDPQTQAIEYSLGPERSYAWVISHDAVEGVSLAPRSQIESAASRLRQAMAGGDPSALEAARRLSRLILSPVAGKLHARRLAIVGDGALQSVPFAALAVPASAVYEPLATQFELVTLPSVSVLQTLREQAAGRTKASKVLAVFADPVFRADDVRASGIHATAGAPAATRGPDLNLGRLSGTRTEAKVILALAPPAARLSALDFDASIARVNGAAMAGYRIVHFATHAFVDSVRPELSGVVLSMVDPQGRPVDGVLRLRDIYNLRWNADLVVLSGCETALGQEISGEGSIGLTRGFMYAGAPRVAASLWKIDDRHTASLMRDFYQAMLGPRNLGPAAALRDAQLQMLRREGGNGSFAWAAFVLTGDWR